jgi:predicted nucleic acid-binding protein
MVLVDTSVWIRFLSDTKPYAKELERLLEQNDVAGHELIFGELLISDVGGRTQLLTMYERIQYAPLVPHSEVVEFIRARRLHGKGIGWLDAHLLASALTSGYRLWTADVSLVATARALRVEHVVGA